MIDKVKRIFAFHKLAGKLSSRDDCECEESSCIKISVESEVDFIKSLLEKKFGRKFQMRVRVNGYLGDDMNYSLVVDDYCNNDSQRKYHSFSGYETKNILDVKSEFLRAYWYSVKKVHDSIGKQLDSWDAKVIV